VLITNVCMSLVISSATNLSFLEISCVILLYRPGIFGFLQTVENFNFVYFVYLILLLFFNNLFAMCKFSAVTGWYSQDPD
jgi:hypothetical protein